MLRSQSIGAAGGKQEHEHGREKERGREGDGEGTVVMMTGKGSMRSGRQTRSGNGSG